MGAKNSSSCKSFDFLDGGLVVEELLLLELLSRAPSTYIFHEGGVVLRAINVFFDFFAQKISRIVTIKNWMEISDIKSGVGGGWGWGVRCLMANAI